MQIVTGIFDNTLAAEKVVSDLLNSGFSKNTISIIMSDKEETTGSHQDASRKAKGGLTGAAIGGALGALIAGLTTIGSILIPGTGLLIVGPLVAALSGAGAGAAVGGVSGALISAGFGADEAKRYEGELSAGKTVIIVHANTPDQIETARTILKNAGANTKAA